MERPVKSLFPTMFMDVYDKLRSQWVKVKPCIEIADVAFVFLRAIILFGGIGWLAFSRISEKQFQDVSELFIFFVIYSVVIYIWLFFYPDKKRSIHVLFLLFDFLFTSLLVRATGGFSSHFLNGFYLMTALYSFYYGLIGGTVIAVIASVLFLISGGFDYTKHVWVDFSVSIAFFFLVAIPLGMLSQLLKEDRDEIRDLNRDLKKYIEELQKVHGRLIQVEKLSELGRLAADVAHEIRNPLTSIGGFARRLENKLSQIKNEKECIRIIKKEKEYTGIILSEVTRLERILRDVLTFSREIKYEMEYHGINEVVTDSLKTFIDICKDQSIKIEVEVADSLPQVLIDPNQVRQAVINLVTNAIDVTAEGGTIKVSTFLKKLNAVDYVTVEIEDTGCGIPEKELVMIFEPFYSSKEIGVGTGLGLSICKKIMDEHNGLILVESKLKLGTLFKLLFPYQSEEEGKKTKCWEFHKCGVEKNVGSAVNICPAYPNYGRICWAIAGTFCGKNVNGAIAQKLGDCRKCKFYQRVVVQKDL
jgi:signal transduction histidine kinase